MPVLRLQGFPFFIINVGWKPALPLFNRAAAVEMSVTAIHIQNLSSGV